MTLTTFETRIRQMILRFQELKKENNALHVQLQKDEQEIQNLKSKLAQADSNYNSLKMAKMLEITDGDLEGAKVNNDRLHIRLHVYDEEVEVTIRRSDEELYRRAAKLITDRYNAYAQAYKGRKGEHTIALMTLIDIALLHERERSKNDTAPYDDVLAKLTSEIEEALK